MMEVQLGFFEAILDLLFVDLRFILGGVVLIGASIYWLHKRKMLTMQNGIILVLFYYYLTVVLNQIVGIPSLKEWMRLSALGESFFHPNVNLIPLADGLSLGFLLNILCFMPLGFFCPMISKTYECVKNTVFVGFGLSFVIEISQMFTRYRATDIDDLIANTLGTLLGYLCFKLIAKLKNGKFVHGNRAAAGLPILYLAAVFVIAFTKL